MAKILITGGNGGLGSEAARQLLKLGHRVITGPDGPTGAFRDRAGELGW